MRSVLNYLYALAFSLHLRYSTLEVRQRSIQAAEAQHYNQLLF